MVRPLYSVEVTETETAKFQTEISEEDVHGNWKLKGEALHQSPVSLRHRHSSTDNSTHLSVSQPVNTQQHSADNTFRFLLHGRLLEIVSNQRKNEIIWVKQL